MIRRFNYWIGLSVVVLILAAGCSTGQSNEGPVGPAGPAGPDGPPGPQGEAASASQSYVGADQCGSCHEEIYDRYVLTGHSNALNLIEDGQGPTYPYDDQTGGVLSPPEGYSWDDISYVVGGFGWMARFADQDGFVITGEEGSSTQYNFENKEVGTEAGWEPFHAGEEQPFDCGICHTTGYADEGHQDSLDGIVGTWEFPGIQCERCHGPGSRHSEDPYGVRMTIDRDPQLCGDCHTRGNPASIAASDGFEHHNQQFSDLFNSKHFALDCITCHDPHASSVYSDEETNPDKGIRQVCESCHWPQTFQNNKSHLGVNCIDCHMAPMAKSAVGNIDTLTADIRSHQFSINPDPEAPQFTEDGANVMPYITLDYACGQCHLSGYATALGPKTMADMASDYHSQPTPTPPPTPTPEPTIEPTPEATPTPESDS